LQRDGNRKQGRGRWPTRPEDRRTERWLVLAVAGTEFAVTVVVCLYLGYLLDQHWLNDALRFPLGILLGTAVGFAAGLYNLLRLLRWAETRRPDV